MKYEKQSYEKIENALELMFASILWKYVNLVISIPAHNAVCQGNIR